MQIIMRRLGYVYHLGTPLAKRVLQNINLHIAPQCWVAVVGRTGSGKSTLIKHINGLLIPTEGEIQVGQYRLKAGQQISPVLYHSVGFLFQQAEQQLFEETVADDIAYGPRQLGWPEEKIKQQVEEMIRLVGLEPSILSSSFLQLSGGQRRRVALASVLIMDPEVLILDEPTAGLDPSGQERLLQTIRHWQRKEGKTVIHVTHQLNHVVQLADQVAVLDEGRLTLYTTPLQLFTQHWDQLDKWGLEAPLYLKLIQKLNQRLQKPIPLTSIKEEDVLQAIQDYYEGRSP